MYKLKKLSCFQGNHLLHRNPMDASIYSIVHVYVFVMFRRALSLDGTCTGEHGIGLGKRQLLEKEIGETGIQVMKQLKTALDPKNIMNPGKVITV